VRSVNLAQRVVLVIAFGAALYILGAYLTGGTRVLTGWTGYAPLQAVPLASRTGLSGTGSILLWLLFVTVWAAGSLMVLRTRRSSTRPPTPVDAEDPVRETGAR
jgi:heme/copper-type cytochrome/quinol oxidase subunit 1